jgi:glycosyltransferase involved in cell wall biosynthesis
VSVVVPALNEAANLPHVLNRLPSFVAELIIVDGGSEDGTVEVARSLRPDARVLVQGRPGKGAALACGVAAATGEIIVTLDADGSADPEEIPRFLAALMAGSDLVKGSRFLPGGGSDDITRLRRTGNRFLCLVANLLHRTRYTDLCYGYNAFWKECAWLLSVDPCGFDVEAQMATRAARSNLRVTEVASWEHARRHGVSNLRAVPDGTLVLRTIIRERLKGRPTSVLETRRAEFEELPIAVSTGSPAPLA